MRRVRVKDYYGREIEIAKPAKCDLCISIVGKWVYFIFDKSNTLALRELIKALTEGLAELEAK